MHVQIWEHFAQQSNQSDFSAEKAANMIAVMLKQRAQQQAEEDLEMLRFWEELDNDPETKKIEA